MRSIALHDATLVQRLAHQIDLHFLQVTHSAVHQFRRAARRTFSEVLAFEQGDAESTGCGIYRTTQSRRTATDNDHIPYLVGVVELFKH